MSDTTDLHDFRTVELGVSIDLGQPASQPWGCADKGSDPDEKCPDRTVPEKCPDRTVPDDDEEIRCPDRTVTGTETKAADTGLEAHREALRQLMAREASTGETPSASV